MEKKGYADVGKWGEKWRVVTILGIREEERSDGSVYSIYLIETDAGEIMEKTNVYEI